MVRYAIPLALAAAMATTAWAEGPSKTARLPETKSKVTVVSVAGKADEFLPDKGRRWAPLRAGAVLDELTIIRTGWGAKVVLQFEDRGELVIRGGTKVGVSQFRRRGREAKARIHLKYGSVRLSVDKGRGPNDFRVVTPVATLAVRGSIAGIVLLLDNPGALKVRVDQGGWRMVSPAAAQTARPGESTDNNGTKNYENLDVQRDIRMVDASGGLTGEEKKNLNRNGGGRGICSNTGSATRDIEPFATPSVLSSRTLGELEFPVD